MRSGEVRLEQRADGRWVVLSGDIDMNAVDAVADDDLDACAGTAIVRVDASDVEFMDSTGLALLLRLRATCADVRLMGAPPRVRRVIDLAGLTELFTFEP